MARAASLLRMTSSPTSAAGCLALLALENPEGGIRVGITSMDVDAAFGSLPERVHS